MTDFTAPNFSADMKEISRRNGKIPFSEVLNRYFKIIIADPKVQNQIHEMVNAYRYLDKFDAKIADYNFPDPLQNIKPAVKEARQKYENYLLLCAQKIVNSCQKKTGMENPVFVSGFYEPFNHQTGTFTFGRSNGEDNVAINLAPNAKNIFKFQDANMTSTSTLKIPLQERIEGTISTILHEFSHIASGRFQTYVTVYPGTALAASQKELGKPYVSFETTAKQLTDKYTSALRGRYARNPIPDGVQAKSIQQAQDEALAAYQNIPTEKIAFRVEKATRPLLNEIINTGPKPKAF